MASSKRRVCIFCSGSFENEGDTLFSSTSLTEQAKFSRFCGELELCSGGVGSVDGKESEFSSRFVAAQFLSALGKSSRTLFTCSECLSLVGQAVEMKSNVEEEECQVIQMQIQLLVKMKALKQCTDLYFKEMNKILERVRNAEITHWEEKDKTGIRRGGDLENDRCDVLLFRERIMDVVTSLGVFRADMVGKLLEHGGRKSAASIEFSSSLFPSVQSNSLPKPTEEDYCEVYDVSGVGDDVDWEMDTFSDSEGPPQNEKTSDQKTINESAVDIKHEDLMANSGNDTNDDQSFQLTDPSEDEESSSKKKRKTKLQKGKRSRISREKSRRDTNLSSDDDLIKLTPLRRRFVIYLRNRNSLLPEESQEKDLSSTTASFPDLKHEYQWNYDPSTDKFTLAGYQIDIEEDKALKKLTYSCSTCNQFQYCYDYAEVMNKNKIMSSAMHIAQNNVFNHIVGKAHLNAFVCPLCPASNAMETYRTYMEHLTQHTVDTTHLKHYCDQCGRGFQKKYGLDRHMVSHMTGEEKEKGLEQFFGRSSSGGITGGNNDNNASTLKKKSRAMKIAPKLSTAKRSDLKAEPRFQCSTCGKSNFKKYAELKNHEWSHVDKELRPSVICPMCGVKLVKTCYSKHLKMFCKALKGSQEDAQPLTCSQCNRSFQNKDRLKEHMKQDHAEIFLQMPYECDQCEIRFCSLSRLKHHRRNVHGSRGGGRK